MNRLFVYGTLLPGQVNWHVLAPYVTDGGTPDTARGAMFDTRLGWPCVSFDPSGPSVVTGRLFTLSADTAAQAWAVLDEFEGIHEGAYTRIEITTLGGHAAWAYQAGDSFPDAIESGDWVAWVARPIDG